MLIPKGSTIIFDEEAHKYSNELGLIYTSCTTLIGKYECHKDFEKIAKACERIGQSPNHPKYLKYKGKSAKQIQDEWKKTTDESCEFGSVRHNYLEDAVKTSNKYKRNANGFINGIIYTIDDIIEKHNYGKIDIKTLDKFNIKDKYPKIYNILIGLIKAGYNIYSEIGVYDNTYMISGLIDILAVNHSTGEFIIVDWKTNKAPIRFDAGYYAKDDMGLLNLDKWVPSDDKMQFPISHLADSVGNHYTLQLSIYAYLVTTFGYKYKGLILCHIRPIEESFRPRDNWNESVEIYSLVYMMDEVKSLLGHHHANNPLTQTKMIF